MMLFWLFLRFCGRLLLEETLDSIGGLWLRREYPLQPVVGVGVVIVDCGRLVLVRRGAEPALGKWSFPGGAGGGC